MNRRLLGTLLACTATGLLGAGVAAATASASGSPAAAAGSAAAGSTSAGSAGGSTPTGHPGRAGRAGELLRHVTHAEATVRRHGHDVTLDLQRGTVTAVHGDALTVRSVDGFTGHYTVAAATRVRVDRRRAAAGSLAAGDRVMVVARHTGGSEPAVVVVARTPGWTYRSGTGSTGSAASSA